MRRAAAGIVQAALVSFAVAGPLAGTATAARSDIVEGNPAAAVKVIIYEDLQCGDCQTLRTLLDEKFLPKYGPRVAFLHRDFPLGRHDWARQAAIAGKWVWEQSSRAGITFRREIVAQQQSITSQSLKAWLQEFATRNHLDAKGIVDALTDARMIALVDQDLQSAQGRGIAKTPTIFIGGVSFIETIFYDDVARAIDEALAK